MTTETKRVIRPESIEEFKAMVRSGNWKDYEIKRADDEETEEDEDLEREDVFVNIDASMDIVIDQLSKINESAPEFMPWFERLSSAVEALTKLVEAREAAERLFEKLDQAEKE